MSNEWKVSGTEVKRWSGGRKRAVVLLRNGCHVILAIPTCEAKVLIHFFCESSSLGRDSIFTTTAV